MRLFTQGLGWTPEATHTFAEHVQDDMCNRMYRGYWSM